jgi:hypothetical protein
MRIKMRNKIVAILMFSIAFFSIPALGKENKISLSFKLKGGYHLMSSFGSGDNYINSVNRSLEDMTSLYNQIGFLNAGYTPIEVMHESPGFGAELELFFHRKFSVALDFNYYNYSSAGNCRVDLAGEELNYFYHYDYFLDSTLIPITASVRYHLKFYKFQAYIGAGIGYYLESLKSLTTSSDPWEEREELLWKAKGQAILPKISAGLSLPIYKFIHIGCEIGCPIGKISSFEIEESDVPANIGKKVTIIDENGETVDYKHDLLGLNVGIYIMLSFGK